MDEIDVLMEALRTVYTSLEKLKSIQGFEIHRPGSVDQHQSMLEDAYAAYDRVENTVEELGQVLEERLTFGEAVQRLGFSKAIVHR